MLRSSVLVKREVRLRVAAPQRRERAAAHQKKCRKPTVTPAAIRGVRRIGVTACWAFCRVREPPYTRSVAPGFRGAHRWGRVRCPGCPIPIRVLRHVARRTVGPDNAPPTGHKPDQIGPWHDYEDGSATSLWAWTCDERREQTGFCRKPGFIRFGSGLLPLGQR